MNARTRALAVTMGLTGEVIPEEHQFRASAAVIVFQIVETLAGKAVLS